MKQPLKITILCSLIVGGIYVAIRYGLSSNNAMDRKERMAALSSSVADYAWVSDTELLVPHTEDGDKPGYLARLQVLNGQLTETRIPNSPSWSGTVEDTRHALSPDGRRLMYYMGDDKFGDNVEITEIGTASSSHVPTGSGNQFVSSVWEKDGASWIELLWSGDGAGHCKLVKRQTGTNREISSRSVTLPPNNWLTPFLRPDCLTSSGDLLGFARDFKLSSVPYIDCLLITISQPNPTCRKFKITPPKGTVLTQLDWSSTRDQFVMSVDGSDVSILDKLWNRISPTPRRPIEYRALCVCNMDGSDLREIARQNREEVASPFTNLQWSPNGKYISWVQNNALFRLPMN